MLLQNILWKREIWCGQLKSAIDAKVLSDDVKLTYLNTLVLGKAKNAIAEFAYSGTLHQDALKTRFGEEKDCFGVEIRKTTNDCGGSSWQTFVFSLSQNAQFRKHYQFRFLYIQSCRCFQIVSNEYDLKSSSVLNQVSKLLPNMKESSSLHSVKKCWRQPPVLVFNDWFRPQQGWGIWTYACQSE